MWVLCTNAQLTPAAAPGLPVCGVIVSFQYPYSFSLPFWTSALRRECLQFATEGRCADEKGNTEARGRSKTNVGGVFRSRIRSTEAAALIEFAVALPLLVVLVVGIFDFGGAFNLKQELNNAAREGANFGASEPTNDLYNNGTPPTIDAVRYLVDSLPRGRKASMTAVLEPCPAPEARVAK